MTKQFISTKIQLWFIVIISAVFYINTLSNQFALDDVMVLTENKSVKQGLSGFGDIITKDGFYGYVGDVNDLSGGRWRPLSLLVFATEYQIFEDNPAVYHLTNFLLYILCCVVFYKLLTKYIFRSNAVAAFIAALIFAIHPVHTEVVANIKSLDEILSLLFLLSTLYFSLEYISDDRKKINLVKALACYAFALLSKENGITFLFIIPLTFYFFTNKNARERLLYYLPFLLVGVIYLLIRFTFFGAGGHPTAILNAPFLYANFQQQLATKTLILGKYLLLLFIPYPLSCDYSYNQIPYVDFSSVYVWIVILIYVALFSFALINVKRKNVFAYGILFFLFSISIVSNFLVDIGATMGERFLFQPSVGFAICIGLLLSAVFSIKKYTKATWYFLGLITVLAGCIILPRNRDWESNEKLFLQDVKNSPNNLRLNLNAGTQYIAYADADSTQKEMYLGKALVYLQRAIQIHPGTVEPYLNAGIVYQRLGSIDSAESYWNQARSIEPDNYKLHEYDSFLSLVYLNKGMKAAKTDKDFTKGILYIQKSINYQSTADNWCDLGAIYFAMGNYKEAKVNFAKALAINPNHPMAKGGYADASSRIK